MPFYFQKFIKEILNNLILIRKLIISIIIPAKYNNLNNDIGLIMSI
jgi:hypothetical protein